MKSKLLPVDFWILPVLTLLVSPPASWTYPSPYLPTASALHTVTISHISHPITPNFSNGFHSHSLLTVGLAVTKPLPLSSAVLINCQVHWNSRLKSHSPQSMVCTILLFPSFLTSLFCLSLCGFLFLQPLFTSHSSPDSIFYPLIITLSLFLGQLNLHCPPIINTHTQAPQLNIFQVYCHLLTPALAMIHSNHPRRTPAMPFHTPMLESF
jgi:hypothetical protein